jgi:NAD(P)-dependent dehydrogenase (short-subunit alcohol dehydrogenase family)
MTNGRFRGRTVVVTGGASGIGRAAVRRFLDEGANVVAGDLNAENGRAMAEAWAADRDHLRFVAGNVADEGDTAALVDVAVHTFGTLDVMFNNAGIGGAFGPVTEIEVADWDRTFEILVRGVFLGTKHAARAMIRQGGGAIVNTASVAGLGGGGGGLAYSACKTAVISITQNSALELAKHRIRVNAVCPGVIFTPLAIGKNETNLGDLVERLQPWPERGRPEDIAAAVAFLASDDASFITGEHLVVDGGIVAAGTRVHQAMDPHGAMQRYVGFGSGTTGESTTSRRITPKEQ